MLKDIVQVRPLPNFCLWLQFEDGVQGIVNLREIVPFTGIFEALQNPQFFAQVAVNPEWGTIFWENGADLDPDVLYSIITGEAIEYAHVNTAGSK
ncbi:MAG: DUF2442 domain-containing protein [Anaerolineales bacterium]